MVYLKNKNTIANKVSLVAEYTAMILSKGLKFRSETALLNICRSLKKTKKTQSFLESLSNATNQCKPYVALLSKKVGSVTYKIPVSLSLLKENSVSISWIVKEPCGLKKGNSFLNIKKKKLYYIN